MPNNHPYLYRVVLENQWVEAIEDENGLIPLSPLDEKTGVVHLSKKEQVIPTLEVHFTPAVETYILLIDAESCLQFCHL